MVDFCNDNQCTEKKIYPGSQSQLNNKNGGSFLMMITPTRNNGRTMYIGLVNQHLKNGGQGLPVSMDAMLTNSGYGR